MEKYLADLVALWPVLLIFISLIPMRMVHTIVHESGHALAISMLTGKGVIMFLGSYADREKSVCLRLGNSEIWFRKNIFKWSGGLCISRAKEITLRQKFFYVLAGPVASLLLAGTLLVIFMRHNDESYLSAFLFIFLVISASGFLYNIVPKYAAITTAKGNLTYNDGAQLKAILDIGKMPSQYYEAIDHYNEKRYKEAAIVLEDVIRVGTKKADIYRLAIDAHMNLKNYQHADRIQKHQVAKLGNLDTHDRINMALLKTHLGKYDEAIRYYRHLLQQDPGNKFNLNNFGYTLNLTGTYEEAMKYLNMALKIDDAFAAAHTNRAYALINLHSPREAKEDLDRSLAIDATDPFTYVCLGIYHHHMWQYDEALEQFEKARQLDPETPLLNKYIMDTHNKMAERRSLMGR